MLRLIHSFALAALLSTGLVHAQQGSRSMAAGVFTAQTGAAPTSGAGAYGTPSAPGQQQSPALQPLQTPTITNPSPTPTAPRAAGERAPSIEAPQAPTPAETPGAPQAAGRNEFQDFVQVSTGRALPLFGYELFRNVPSTFAPLDNVPVTPDYTIGPGDGLYIRAWGQIDVDFRTVVDRNGTIAIPRVGVINVAGIKYQDLTAYVKTAVARVFRNFELTVTMGQLRSIQVFVVGQARRPGTYTVSSLSTLVNAIFAAGGPSAQGSMRSIQLKRGNETVVELDLYDLLLKGDKSKDAALLPGDVIYFPPAGPLAALSGSVKTPAIFELKGAATVGTLIEWAGGLATTAQTRLATIERIENRRTRTVDKFSLDQEGLERPIRDGDLVNVYAISPKFENAVTLRGNVAAPLRHPYRAGMRVRDLIPEREALITPDYYLKRNLATRIDVKSGEQLRTEVKNVLAEINWDYAVIERLDVSDLTTMLLPFNLGKAVLEGDPEHNLLLQPGDTVTVFSKDDINVPVARRTHLIRLEGELAHPGIFKAEPGETLRALVARVGGLTPNAFLFGAEFTRESTRREQERRYQEVLNRMERELEAQAAARAQSALSTEDVQALPAQVAAQRATISRLRQLKPQGRIVLELPPNAKPGDLPEIPLEDGDRFVVPPQPTMVSVYGAVFAEASFLYRPDRKVSDYLALAGGATKRADTSQIFLLRADGSVAESASLWFGNRVGGTTVLPGDTVVVPEDFERTTFTKNLKDWTQILYQFGLGAAAIKVLRE